MVIPDRDHRGGYLAGVVEQARFLASPVTGESDEDIALGSDLRAVALMNLGTAEAWSLGLPDAERHLREGAVLAREIGRPYLEVGCLAQLAFASRIRSFATSRRRCREAIALAERHGWGAESVIAPALMTLAAAIKVSGCHLVPVICGPAFPARESSGSIPPQRSGGHSHWPKL